MRIEAIAEDAIIVELSPRDMHELNITYEEMDYSKIETKRVIWTLLSKARRTLGREIDTGGKFFVEAMGRENGGCVLFFSAQNERTVKRYKLKAQSEYIIAEFENAYAMLNCVRQIKGNFRCAKSELYVNGGIYRLLIMPYSASSKLKLCLAEYGKAFAENALLAAHTAEHWRCLIKRGAVEKLALEE